MGYYINCLLDNLYNTRFVVCCQDILSMRQSILTKMEKLGTIEETQDWMSAWDVKNW